MSQSQKEAAEYAEVLLAYSRGERIQMRILSSHPWKELTYPLWDFARYQYRVAPKLVERWARVHDNEIVCVHNNCSTKEEAESVSRICGGRVILMREVTE